VAQDSLEAFFDAIRTNQKTNRVLFAHWYKIIELVDDCFVRASKASTAHEHLVVDLLRDRSHFAFKAAAGMALAGQVVEVFPILRSVLEHAGYALAIHETPTLKGVFANRHDGAAELAASKREFTIKAVREAIARHDTKLAQLYADFYQRTIDFGGHPNPIGIYSSTDFSSRNGRNTMKTSALSDDPLLIESSLKSTAQVGLAALHVLEKAFTERFRTFGITHKMLVLVLTGLL
jgi:hypothetical protein